MIVQDEAKKFLAKIEFTKKLIEEGKNRIKEIDDRVDILKEAAILSKACAQKFVDNLFTIEELVTQGLQEFTQQDYKFEVDKILHPDGSLKGLQFFITSPDGVRGNPLVSFGSAICQVVTIILEIILVALSGDTQPIKIMDEPFSHAGLSAGLRKNIEKFIFKLAEDSDVTILIISHIETTIGSVYEVSKINGISIVERVN